MNINQAVISDGIDELRSSTRGDVLTPSDGAYEEVRRIWNALIDRHPGAILRCSGTADVAAAVKWARKHDIEVSVRGGGHNVGGRAVCDGGLMIDLSRMRSVYVDPVAKTVRAQGGALLGDVDRETHIFGLAVPLGVVSQTGIGGLVTGGGFGWQSRKRGASCDNVIEMEIVTAEGGVLTASAEENADLFWGVRGGGGNFGVVTSFLFRAYDLATVVGGLIAYARDAGAQVLRGYRDFTMNAPEDLTVYAGFIWGPDGTPLTALVPCWIGDDKEAGKKAIEPLTKLGEPLMVEIGEMPFPAMQAMLDEAYAPGSRNYWKSAYLENLSDAAIDEIVRQAEGMTIPGSALLIEHTAGATLHRDANDNALASRGWDYLLGVMPMWQDAKDDEEQIAWARNATDAMEPYSSGMAYANYVSEGDEAIMEPSFGDNLKRLREVKRKYDPGNFFHLNANIAP
ncbi:FAD-binding oxidoreductase [Defluviimonas sp. WL0002]|uniref:FAD-binding oxidoreductase n=1 Tax=Albidovulum marisflavi TaxID=2984159 RepID=A0ABT2Z8R0_9RHOB|nr:FAD-binding oxidoreductase [Defluviimonas sp. WL0002]MCV2867468.1 FAD-binding oxidoreductase [Defluviimonas sp. WL0002]